MAEGEATRRLLVACDWPDGRGDLSDSLLRALRAAVPGGVTVRRVRSRHEARCRLCDQWFVRQHDLQRYCPAHRTPAGRTKAYRRRHAV